MNISGYNELFHNAYGITFCDLDFSYVMLVKKEKVEYDYGSAIILPEIFDLDPFLNDVFTGSD